MNPVLLAVVTLRAAALAASLAGRHHQAEALYAAADLVASGKAVDEHMQGVADKLAAGDVTEQDWANVKARILADSERLHAG